MLKNSLFPSVLFVVVIVSGVFALQCYYCDSSDKDGCQRNKNFEKLPSETCPDVPPLWIDEIQCSRMTVKVEENGKENTYVVRGCMPKESCDTMKENNKNNNRNFTVTECYVCKTDFCNSKRRKKKGMIFPLNITSVGGNKNKQNNN